MFSAFPTPKVEWNRENLRWMLCAFPLVGAAVGLLCWGWAALGVFGYYRHMARTQFGGLSGDLAGWFLQTAELWMLGTLVLGQYVEGIL